MLVKLKKNKQMSATIDCTSIGKLDALPFGRILLTQSALYGCLGTFHMDWISFNQ